MAEEKAKTEDTKKPRWAKKGGSASGGTCGGAYFLAFLGAFIYYLHHTDTFWQGVLAFLKALVWPAFLVYKLFNS